MRFNPEQEKAVYGEEPLIVVAAGAGSGKTKVLTERYVYLCDQHLQQQFGNQESEVIGAEASGIVALTFTEDAALEMKDRIRKRLEEKLLHVQIEFPHHREQAEKFWKYQIESLDYAVISTFHSFCQRIVSDHSFEANVFPNIKVMEETDSKLLKAEVIQEILEEGDSTGKWHLLTTTIYPKALQSSLFAVHAKLNEFEIETSIKETLKIENMLTEWDEMKDSQLNCFESELDRFFKSSQDISKLTAATKKTYEVVADIYRSGKTSEQLFDALKQGLSSSIKKTVPIKYQNQNSNFYDLMACWLKTRNVWDQSPSEEDNVFLETIIQEFGSMVTTFSDKYENKKRELALLDFSDLQQKAIALLNNPDIQSYYSKMYKHFLVDEFQDTNQLQMRMLEKVNPEYSFIVGDGKQSIYRFRGADVQLLNSLAKTAKRNPSYSFVDMNVNYRTCDSIINFINLLFQQEHLMGTELPEGAPLYKTEYSPLKANRNSKNEQQTRVEYIRISEEKEKSTNENQYVMIARRMIELIKDETEIYDKEKEVWRPVNWRDMAVLMASRTDLPRLEKAFYDLEIPFNVYGGLGFYQRQEVVDYISILQWLNKPYEPLYIMALLRSPLFGVTMDEFLEIQDARGENITLSTFIYEKHFLHHPIEQLRSKLERFYQFYKKWVPFHWSGSIKPILQQLFEESKLKTVLLLQKNSLSKLKNVEKVIETIAGFRATSMDQMLIKLSIIADLSEKEGDADVELVGGNFVHIMTVHGSKGLEFPVVSVPHLSKGIPSESEMIRYDHEDGLYLKVKKEDEGDLLAEPIEIKSANFDEVNERAKGQAIEESKRLFYVALTRARDLLILSSQDHGYKNTWYSWLEEGVKNCDALKDFIQIIEDVPVQTPVKNVGEFYQGPTERIERSIPVSFSVSEVTSYLKDSDGFVEKHILRIDEQWLQEEFEVDVEDNNHRSEDSAIQATVLGTLVHRICELLDLGYSKKSAYLEAFSAYTDNRESELYYQKTLPLVNAYQQKKLGIPIENEWEFSIELDGSIIIGEIDKIVETENGIEVIDLKTNRINDNLDELVEYYRPQLYLYKLAYEKIKNVHVDKMSLLFLRDTENGLYEIPYDQSYEKKVMNAVRVMAELKGSY